MNVIIEQYSVETKDDEVWQLSLYIAGQTPKSVRALANLRAVCEKHLVGKYKIQIIDLIKTPQIGRTDQILAIPTLIRKRPAPCVKIIGDLSHTESVLVGLGIHPK